MIEAGKPLLEIDSRLVQKEIEVSESELKAAQLKAKDDSNYKFSIAAEEVARADVAISNVLQEQGAEHVMEGEKKRLELKKAGFQVSVSKIEKLRDAADVEVKQAKLEAAKVQLDLRTITAQRTGVVTDVAKRRGDWVRAGEVILRLTSMNKIRVEGNAEVGEIPPHLLQNLAENERSMGRKKRRPALERPGPARRTEEARCQPTTRLPGADLRKKGRFVSAPDFGPPLLIVTSPHLLLDPHWLFSPTLTGICRCGRPETRTREQPDRMRWSFSKRRA